MPAVIRITAAHAKQILGSMPANGAERPRPPEKLRGDYTATQKLLSDLQFYRIPTPVREHRFHPKRMWRFDLAWPDDGWKIAVEIEGGAFGRSVRCNHCLQLVRSMSKRTGRWYTVREGGGHNTGKALEKDMEKYNAAVELGWRVLRYSPKMIREGVAISEIRRVFCVALTRQGSLLEGNQ